MQMYRINNNIFFVLNKCFHWEQVLKPTFCCFSSSQTTTSWRQSSKGGGGSTGYTHWENEPYIRYVHFVFITKSHMLSMAGTIPFHRFLWTTLCDCHRRVIPLLQLQPLSYRERGENSNYTVLSIYSPCRGHRWPVTAILSCFCPEAQAPTSPLPPAWWSPLSHSFRHRCLAWWVPRWS